MIPDEGETAAYLLSFMEEQNYPLTSDQLRRLHLEGLIARPAQFHREGRVGSETVYPEGTGDLLLAICSLRQQKRSLSTIAWQLWWDGHPVPLARIRADLQKAVEEWVQLRRRFCPPGTRRLSKVAWKLLGKVASYRFRQPFINQARKRVGTISFDTFMRLLLEIAAGNFQGFTDDGANSREEERKILEKGFGLNRARVGSSEALGSSLADNIESSLAELSRLMATDPWEKWLEQASDDELLRHRDELHLLLSAFESLSSAMDDIFGKRAVGASIFFRTFCEAGRKHLPVMYLFWSTLHWCVNTPLDELLQSARQWLEEALPAYEALCQLQVEVPAIRPLLSRRRIKEALRNERAQRRHFAECQLFYQQHREELMAFWQCHPEWEKLGAGDQQAGFSAC